MSDFLDDIVMIAVNPLWIDRDAQLSKRLSRKNQLCLGGWSELEGLRSGTVLTGRLDETISVDDDAVFQHLGNQVYLQTKLATDEFLGAPAEDSFALISIEHIGQEARCILDRVSRADLDILLARNPSLRARAEINPDV